MEVVLNDYSLESQFDNIEDFVDSLAETTFIVLNYLKNQSYILLKSYITYDKCITKDISVYEFLSSQRFRGFAEAQKLRSLLSDLISDPFWEYNIKTDANSIYNCEYMGEFEGNTPNCFSEALERDGVVLSFQHDCFKKESISIYKNGIECRLYNLFDKYSGAHNLFLLEKIRFSEYLQSCVHDCKVLFYGKDSQCYIDEEYESSDLSKEDAISIKEDFGMLINGRVNGKILSRLVDSISYKGITYNEFRTSISNNREFRLFYYIDGDKWVFLNSLIKKTEVTPEYIKKRTYDLINRYKQ